MIEEPFAGGDAPLLRLDPRIRVVVAGAFSLLVAVSRHFPTLGAALLLAAILVWTARLDFLQVMRRLLAVAGFLALLWLVLPVSVSGPVLCRLGPLAISRPGIALAAQVTLKSMAILTAVIALVATMNLAVLGHALAGLGLPLKLVHLLLFSYRYIFVIEDEYRRLLRAVRVRGFTPRTDLHTYRTIAYLAAMIFVRAAARAERVEQAMRCRGFDGRFYCLFDFPAHPRQRQFALGMAMLLIGLALLEWGKVFLP
ncbi:MAG: cobalt ECF transporter T component CbiQ [Deltaproteobacteria bacterium]|nr:cobalt ECF transporter T component CbiQ [Candidatus Anaeroferrophillacea bacterium]